MAELRELIRRSNVVPGEEAPSTAPRPGNWERPNFPTISHVNDDNSNEDCLFNEYIGPKSIFGAEGIGRRAQKPIEDRKYSDLEWDNVDDRALLALFMRLTTDVTQRIQGKNIL